MCINAAKLTLPRARDNAGIPGWNDKTRLLKDTADFWSEIWRQNDRPDVGLIADKFDKYYTSRRGQVYCCLLDVTKTFDSVRFDKLFEIIIERNVPVCIVRILIDMYTRQRVRTMWEGCFSEEF